MESEFIERLRSVGGPIFAAHGVAVAYLYGSRARGRYTRLSDVDVAVVTTEEPLPRERLRLELALELDLRDALGEEFDVRVINDAPILVRGRVLQTGKRIYVGDERRRIAFEENTRRLYLDFLPFLQRQRQMRRAAERAARARDGDH